MDIVSYTFGKKKGGGGTPPVYQDKEVSITQNGTTTITKDSGYDALSSVELTVAVPQPTGTISITQNGTGIDVSSYASADVNVPAGIDPAEYFNSTGTATNSEPYLWGNLIKKIPPITISGNSLSYAFYYYKGTELPQITNLSSITNFSYMCTGCSNLQTVDFSNQGNITANDFLNAFLNCSSLTEVNLSNLTTPNFFDGRSMFYKCTNLKKVYLNNLNPSGYNGVSDMFNMCYSLEELDISSMTMPTSSFSGMFTGVPANCLIYVKDQTAKDWFTTNFSRLTNVQIKS